MNESFQDRVQQLTAELLHLYKTERLTGTQVVAELQLVRRDLLVAITTVDRFEARSVVREKATDAPSKCNGYPAPAAAERKGVEPC